MTDIKISTIVFLSCLVAMIFHFSGFIAGKNSTKHGDWTFWGAFPFLASGLVAVGSLIVTIYKILSA